MEDNNATLWKGGVFNQQDIKIKQFETVLKLVINGTHLLKGLRSDAFSCNNIPSM